MSMQSAGYTGLLTLIEEAQVVVSHPTFEGRFTIPEMADMYRDVFGILAGLFRDADFVAFDHEVAVELTPSNAPGSLSLIIIDNWLLGRRALELRTSLDTIPNSAYSDKKLDGEALNSFRSSVTRFVDEIMESIRPLRSGSSDGADRALKNVRSELSESKLREVDRLLEAAEAGVAKIAEKEAIADDALGSIGGSQLAKHYKEYADTQAGAAGTFRMWTIITASIAGAVASALLIGPSLGLKSLEIQPGDYVHLIQRIIVTAALFGLAGYLARQAHQHRSLANWAGSLAVQLQTFDAFVSPVASSDVRDELRKVFAERAFGDHPAMRGEPGTAPSTAIAEKAIEIAAKTLAPKA